MGIKTGIKPINKGGGKWLIRICCGYDARGKKQMQGKVIQLDPKMSEAKQLAEAIKERDRWRIQYEDGLVSAEKDITFKAYSEEWIDSYCRRKGLEASTISGYQTLLNTRIIPQLGKYKLREIKPPMLDKLFGKMAKEGLSGTSQKRYFNLLHLIMECAVKAQRITINPTIGIESPKIDTGERPVYDAQQSERFVIALEHAPVKWRAFMLLALGSGMRRGEMVGLDWTDVDFETHAVHVRRAYGKAKGVGQYAKKPKTKSGERSIRIDTKTLEALKDWKREQAAQRLKLGSFWKDENAVFTQDDGKRMHIDSPTGWIRKFQEKNGLPPLNLHGLRHTGASLLLANHVPVTDVSKRLGHSRVSTTMDIYSHAYDEGDKQIADQMGALMYGKNG